MLLSSVAWLSVEIIVCKGEAVPVSVAVRLGQLLLPRLIRRSLSMSVTGGMVVSTTR